MRLDFSTLSVLYVLCGIGYGTWHTFYMFRGGENSRFYDLLRRKAPVAAIAIWQIQLIAGINVVLAVILWPLFLGVHLWSAHKKRKASHLLFAHPTLAKLRASAAGREASYSAIFAEFGLDILTRAVEAIDLDSITPKLTPQPEGALETLTYADTVAGALIYTQIDAYVATMRRSDMQKANALRRELAVRYHHFWEPVETVCLLIEGHVHGWLPARHLSRIKCWYASHLLPEYSNADHLYAVFGGIESKSSHAIRHVAPKKADMTPEEHNRALADAFVDQPPVDDGVKTAKSPGNDGPGAD